MKEIYLNLGMTIGIQSFSSIRVDVGITEEKLENETENELFNRATKKVKEMFEAELALQANRILKIKDKCGLLPYLESISTNIYESENPYIKEFLEEIKKEKKKEEETTKEIEK